MRRTLRQPMRGMTMIELVVAIVILGVGISGMMLAFSTVAGGSANPIVLRQMQAIADEMVAEIALKPYVPKLQRHLGLQRLHHKRADLHHRRGRHSLAQWIFGDGGHTRGRLVQR